MSNKKKKHDQNPDGLEAIFYLDYKQWRVKFYKINRWHVYADFYEAGILTGYEYFESDNVEIIKHRAIKRIKRILEYQDD